jgi:branched-chain amino acid transport system substrate-binding protein
MSGFRPRDRMLVCGLFAMLVLAACGSSSSTSSSSSPSSASHSGSASHAQALPSANPSLHGQITIGAAVPLTGSGASIGADQVRGVQLAAAEINHDGGVLGKKLTVAVEDTQTKTVPAVQAATKLVTVNHVPVVIGEYLSNDTIAIGKYLQKVGVVQINPGSSSPLVAGIGSDSFSSIGLDTLAGRLAAEHLYQEGYRKIAFLGPNNAYGSGFAQVIGSRFRALGGAVTTSILYTEGEPSYNSELQRLKSSGAQIYVYATYEPDGITINKEAYALGLNATKMYGIYLSICVEGAPVQSFVGQRGQDLAYIGPHGQAYESAYTTAFGQSPVTPYSGYAFDATMMAAQAINAAKNANPGNIAQELRKLGHNYQGATGSISFDSHGQRISAPYSILVVNSQGKLVQQSLAHVSEPGQATS